MIVVFLLGLVLGALLGAGAVVFYLSRLPLLDVLRSILAQVEKHFPVVEVEARNLSVTVPTGTVYRGLRDRAWAEERDRKIRQQQPTESNQHDRHRTH